VDDSRFRDNLTHDGWIHRLNRELLFQKAYEVSTSTMRERMDDLTGGLELNLPGLGMGG
jgi:hypothetical protein